MSACRLKLFLIEDEVIDFLRVDIAFPWQMT
jgi:hypothetical protein